MQTLLLKGAPVAAEVYAALDRRLRRAPRAPGLAAVLVGDDPASRTYVASKTKACQERGFHHVTHALSADCPQAQVLELIADLNADPAIDGILVQLPLPPGLDRDAILEAVDPAKDVDGFHPRNLGLLVAGRPRVAPCTPKGILRLLAHYRIPTAGRTVAVVGRSVIVGRPLSLLLSLKGPDGDATVTMCHSGTPDLTAITRRAQIVVAAMGAPRALGAAAIGQGAVVVDVGINRVSDAASPRGYRLVGDVDAEAIMGVAAAVTPVPGGIGPMTIAMLLENTCEAMARIEGWDG